MIKEWLLIAWLGTSTNFVLLSHHWNLPDCQRARAELAAKIAPGFVLVCTQDMREGRSQYPSRGGDSGLVK